MLGHLALLALEMSPDIADAAGGAIESLSAAVTRRLIAGATTAAVQALPGVGSALLGGLGQAIQQQVRQQVGEVASSLNVATVREVLTGEMGRLGLALVNDAELQALRAVAAAAQGSGDLAAALAALNAARST